MECSRFSNLKTLKAFWYRDPAGCGNYGDELGPYIIHRLSGQNIVYLNICKHNGSNISRKRFLTDPRYAFSVLRDAIIRKWTGAKVIVAVGSIISWFRYRNAQIWGAGIMHRTDRIYPADFYAVRGVYTARQIRKAGLEAPEVYGDPGLLMPLVFQPTSKKRYKMGFIPHYIHFQEIKSHVDKEDILVIDMLQDVEKVTEDINSCEMTLSSSLHGLVVSHAYRIPSLWVQWSEKKLAGDNVKFGDYFSTVSIAEYDPVDVAQYLKDKRWDELQDIQLKYKLWMLPDSGVIKKIQNGLISQAPFSILEKYKLQLSDEQ